MTRRETELEREAARWALRVSDAAPTEPSADEWRAFTAWLETEGAAAALDRAEAALALVERHRAELQRARRPVGRPAAAWLAGAGAAAAAAALVWIAFPAAPAMQTFRAPSDRPLDVRLSDGTQVALNRGSGLAVRFSGDARRVGLAPGSEATFDVAHQPGRPFTVAVGAASVTVTGTRFDVDAAAGALRVAVSRGRVLVRTAPGAPAWTLTPGRALTRTPSGAVELAAVSAADVGAWRSGALAYTDAPLSQVAADLGRYWGSPVRADPSLAGRRFTGVLALDTPERMRTRLEALADLKVAAAPGGEVLRRRERP